MADAVRRKRRYWLPSQASQSRESQDEEGSGIGVAAAAGETSRSRAASGKPRVRANASGVSPRAFAATPRAGSAAKSSSLLC